MHLSHLLVMHLTEVAVDGCSTLEWPLLPVALPLLLHVSPPSPVESPPNPAEFPHDLPQMRMLLQHPVEWPLHLVVLLLPGEFPLMMSSPSLSFRLLLNDTDRTGLVNF